MLKSFFDQKPSFTTSAVMIVIGFVLTVFPDLSGKIFCNMLGACLMLFAVLNLWTYAQNRARGYHSKSIVITAAISAFLALICFTKAYMVLSFLPFILGVILAAFGATKIPFVIDCIKHSVSGSALFIASSLIPLVLGVILMFNPFGVTRTVIMFFGISLIVNGIMDLSGAFYFKSKR